MDDPNSLPSAAVVTCVESGSLEDQAVRMIGSLRKWGGALSQLPVYAVKPRRGAPLSGATRRELDRLKVTLIRADARNYTPYDWLGFFGKPVAVAEMEKASPADVIIWLDGDTLVVKEPTELLLDAQTDFAAVAVEKSVGSSGPADPFEPYWQAMADSIGVPLDDIGWVTTERGQRPIRLYFNSGIMAFRRGTGFVQEYIRAFNQVMNDRFAVPQTGYYLHEQAILGFVLAKKNLRWRGLSQAYNYRCGMRGLASVVPEDLRAARILHYHRAMNPEHWEAFLKFLAADNAPVSQWLRETAWPVGTRTPLLCKAINNVLRKLRGQKAKTYRRSCRELPITAKEGEG
jgi:hypothetical protein